MPKQWTVKAFFAMFTRKKQVNLNAEKPEGRVDFDQCCSIGYAFHGSGVSGKKPR
jgi:hypothetical protein